MTGDIILFYTPLTLNPLTWISALIRLFQGKYSHIGVEVDNWGVPFINEAIGIEVKCTPSSVRLKEGNYKRRRGKEAIVESDFARKANSMLGKRYDIVSLCLWMPIYKITGKWYGSRGNKAHGSLICSEYVALCYELPNAELIDVTYFLNSDKFYDV